MIKKFNRYHITYLYIISFILLIAAALYAYHVFNKTKNSIVAINMEISTEYVNSLSDNLVNDIVSSSDGDIHRILKAYPELREYLNKHLQLFITTRYKYIYLVDQEEEGYRFLLDGAVNDEDRGEFEEDYTPLNIDKFDEAYRNKKALFFMHQDISSLWMTYLKPVVIDDKTKALLVIDFSLEKHDRVETILQDLDGLLLTVIGSAAFIFIFIIYLIYMDNRREDIKDRLYKKLKIKTEELKQLNNHLEARVQTEVEKNRQKDKQMMQQSRLAQMGEMISMIAHQWRQPLAAISSTSSTINLNARLNQLENDEAVKLTNDIAGYVKHLSATIDDFREFFKPNKCMVETTYPKLLESVLGIIKTSLNNHDIKFIQELNCSEKIITYPNEIKQVLLNLIKNAEDTLVEKAIENPYIKIATYTDGEKYILEVSDNGGGVPMDIIDNIFNPYFSTKTKKDGTGLGLYMSKTIVEEHCSGELHASNSDEGAVFTMILNKNSYVEESTQ